MRSVDSRRRFTAAGRFGWWRTPLRRGGVDGLEEIDRRAGGKKIDRLRAPGGTNAACKGEVWWHYSVPSLPCLSPRQMAAFRFACRSLTVNMFRVSCPGSGERTWGRSSTGADSVAHELSSCLGYADNDGKWHDRSYQSETQAFCSAVGQSKMVMDCMFRGGYVQADFSLHCCHRPRARSR